MLLERALIEPPAAGERAGILLSLGQAELSLGRREAAGHLEEAMRLATTRELRTRIVSRLAVALAFMTDVAASERLIADALAELDPGDEEQRRLLRAAYRSGSQAGVLPGLTVDHDREPALGRLRATTPGERLLLATASFGLGRGGSGAEAADLAERGLAGGQLIRDDFPESPAVGQAIQVLVATDRTDASELAIETGFEVARERGSLLTFAWMSMLRCHRNWMLGKLAEAEADGRAVAELVPDIPALGFGGSAYLARVLVDRGEPDEADQLVTRSVPRAGQATIGLFVYSRLAAIAHVREAQGRWREAADAALEIGRLEQERNVSHPGRGWRIQAAIPLALLGEREAAAELLAQQRPITEHWGVPRSLGLLERAEAFVAEGEERIARLERATATLAATPARLDHARTLIDLGGMLRRAGRRVDSREALRAGLDLADRCGAYRLVEIATGELTATGAHLRRTRLSGIESLTPSELRIARLAATGLSNPEIAQSLFISRKTVERHLGSTYAKLDINGRSALSTALANDSDGEGDPRAPAAPRLLDPRAPTDASR